MTTFSRTDRYTDTARDAADRDPRAAMMAMRERYTALHTRRAQVLAELAAIDRDIVETREARDAFGIAYNAAKRAAAVSA